MLSGGIMTGLRVVGSAIAVLLAILIAVMLAKELLFFALYGFDLDYRKIENCLQSKGCWESSSKTCKPEGQRCLD